MKEYIDGMKEYITGEQEPKEATEIFLASLVPGMEAVGAVVNPRLSAAKEIFHRTMVAPVINRVARRARL